MEQQPNSVGIIWLFPIRQVHAIFRISAKDHGIVSLALLHGGHPVCPGDRAYAPGNWIKVFSSQGPLSFESLSSVNFSHLPRCLVPEASEHISTHQKVGGNYFHTSLENEMWSICHYTVLHHILLPSCGQEWMQGRFF